MTGQSFTMTLEQKQLLEQNPQHHAVSFLDDGDLLICEDARGIFRDDSPEVQRIWSPWILTRAGQVQSLIWHYENHHKWLEESPGREAFELTRPTKPVPHVIITVEEAAGYLLLKYRVDVTPRTVRNWLHDGKLAGGQLGTADRSPWYTTRDAIDVAATRDWFPAPAPELVDVDVDDPRAPKEWVAIVTGTPEAADRVIGAAEEIGKRRLLDSLPGDADQEAEAELEADAALGHLLADVDDQELDAQAEHDEWLEHLDDEPLEEADDGGP